MKQLNFNNQKANLTEEDKEEIFEILAKKTRQATRVLLAKRLDNHLDLIPEYGIFNRLIKENYGWIYCAGQSYPDEIRTLRKIVLNLK
jgi:hypothetical protein